MHPLPDLEALAVFARVAEAGSFSRAAEACGLSKATVSKIVARLEARLGTTLFHRTSRRLSLSETGRALAARAAAILAEAEAVEAEVMDQAAAPRGRVRLTAPMSFGLKHVGPLLPDFLSAYPDISVELELSDQMVDLVAGGFDAALRIGVLEDSSLKARRLREVKIFATAAPAYLDRHGRPETPADLRTHACFSYAYFASGARWRFLHPDGRDETVLVSGPLTVNNSEALLPALLAGHGVAVQPDFMIGDAVEAGRLERVLPEWSLPSVALHVVTPPSSHRPSKVTALLDFLAARLKA
jgi:DNA-binding transcriptional LysR family regulator